MMDDVYEAFAWRDVCVVSMRVCDYHSILVSIFRTRKFTFILLVMKYPDGEDAACSSL